MIQSVFTARFQGGQFCIACFSELGSDLHVYQIWGGERLIIGTFEISAILLCSNQRVKGFGDWVEKRVKISDILSPSLYKLGMGEMLSTASSGSFSKLLV